ncbi:MAG: MlaD family protein [Desulfurivibrionaceae bacterium]
MSQKGSPAVIGFFVIGAAVILTATVIILGNISFDKDRSRYILYFQGSLHGLSEGAPVTYRGIKIGQVADIAITFDPRGKDYRTPVYVDINKDILGGQPTYKGSDKAVEKRFLQDMIDRGLRAKLKMQSLVTGQLYIDLDFYPELETRFTGTESDYIEIPTLPSKMEQLTTALANLELESLINRAVDALDNLNSFLTSDNTRKLVSNFSKTFEHLDNLIVNTDRNLPLIVEDLRTLTDDFNRLTNQLNKTLKEGENELGLVSTDLRNTLDRIDRAASKFTEASANIQKMTEKNSRLSYELNNTLHEVGKAAESVNALADLLQRNPDVLLYGPRKKEEK